MLALEKVAVTGGVACGKTVVCHFLKQLGAYVVNADEIVHQLLLPNTEIGQQVVKLIGNDIVADGTIDRSIIAKRVFNQPDLLESLEKILHPAVRETIEQLYQHAQAEGKATLFVAEIPLLFEVGGEKDFDLTIVVIADKTICKERFMKTGQEYEKRANRQWDLKEKKKKADFIIYNEESLDDLFQDVKCIYNQITKK